MLNENQAASFQNDRGRRFTRTRDSIDTREERKEENLDKISRSLSIRQCQRGEESLVYGYIGITLAVASSSGIRTGRNKKCEFEIYG